MVGTLSGYDDLKSGNQQDAVEFFTLLFQELLPSYIESFAREENVEVKFVIDGKYVPCPNCGTSPIKPPVKDNILHVTLPRSSCDFVLKVLIDEYFGSQCNEDGMKCSVCCPHGDGICPGTENCISRTYVEQRHFTKYPEVLLIQLMRFEHNYLKDSLRK